MQLKIPIFGNDLEQHSAVKPQLALAFANHSVKVARGDLQPRTESSSHRLSYQWDYDLLQDRGISKGNRSYEEELWGCFIDANTKQSNEVHTMQTGWCIYVMD